MMTKDQIINKFFKRETSFFGYRYCIYSNSWRINKNGELQTLDEYWSNATWSDFHEYLQWKKKEEKTLKSDNNVNKFKDWNEL